MTWTDEQLALQESTREFVRREVSPHLQEWEDAGEVPRSLHLAAAKAGLLGVSFPEEVGGQGGTLLDSVAMQEAFFEAGGSSGLAAALFTGGIALPHMAAHGTPEQIDAFVRPTLAGREDRVARGHRARWRVRRRGDHHDRRRATATPTSSTAPRPSSPAGSAPTSSPPPSAPVGPGHAGVSLLVVEKGTPGFTVDRALSKMGWHCSDTAELSFVDVRVPATNLVGERERGFYLIAEQFVVERIALAVHAYGIAARSLALTAAYCRERETFGKPLIANQVVQHKLVEMHSQVEVARTYTREVAGVTSAGDGGHRRGLPGQADRRRGVRPRRRPGRAAARRHRLHARDRGGAALPRRPDPRHRRRSDRSAHRPVRTTAGVRAMSLLRPLVVRSRCTSTLPSRRSGRSSVTSPASASSRPRPSRRAGRVARPGPSPVPRSRAT